jgi:hypothetical protein
MEKEIKNQSICHLPSHRSLMIENENCTSDKITWQHYLSSQKSDTKINDDSIQTPTNFCYKKICTTCIPESIRIDQEKNQQINIDVLYPYDPYQIEVGESNKNSLCRSRNSFLEYDDKCFCYCCQDLIYECVDSVDIDFYQVVK